MNGYVYTLADDCLTLIPVRVLVTQNATTITYTVYDDRIMDRCLYTFALNREGTKPLLDGELNFMLSDGLDDRCIFFDLLPRIDCWRIRTNAYGLFVNNTAFLKTVIDERI